MILTMVSYNFPQNNIYVGHELNEKLRFENFFTNYNFNGKMILLTKNKKIKLYDLFIRIIRFTQLNLNITL